MTRAIRGGYLGKKPSTSSAMWKLSDSGEFGLTQVPSTLSVEYLVVGGGGSGGPSYNVEGGGGGGAGAMLENTMNLFTNTAYPIIVGAGGSGIATTIGNYSFFVESAVGGGRGGGRIGGGGVLTTGGGSGAGARGASYNFFGSGVVGRNCYGNDGNVGIAAGSYPSGGGGGAGSAAIAPVNNTTGGVGGAGRSNSLSGSATYYAGGGGGACTTKGAGGVGGGGDGSQGHGSGSPGSANTGGGGGGSYSTGVSTQCYGSNGGSGIIILKIPSANSATFSAGVTQTLSTDVPNYKIYTVTAAGPTDTVTFS